MVGRPAKLSGAMTTLSGSMAATVSVAMTATDLIRGKFLQVGLPQTGQVVGDGHPFGPINLEPGTVQSEQGAGADAADDDGVRCLTAEGLEWAAGTMGVVQVAIGELAYLAGFSIDQHEPGGGTEMAENFTVQTFIAFYRETEFHDFLLWLFLCISTI
jgi:hypothetical protein